METNFLKNKNLFFKKLENSFVVKSTMTESVHIHTKLPSQKPMLRQIEWGVQNGPITKNTVLPVSIFFIFYLKILLQYKNLV